VGGQGCGVDLRFAHNILDFAHNALEFAHNCKVNYVQIYLLNLKENEK
jgi:hypothetical protein